MPFGNNKRLSMPRPKKKKSAAREDAQVAKKQRVMEAVEEQPPPVAAQVAVPPSSPGAAQRKQAKEEEEDLWVEYEGWRGALVDLKKDFHCAEKLSEARQRCLDRRAGKGSPYGELERIYKRLLDFKQAQNAWADQQLDACVAEKEWHKQRVVVLQLENAKLRRMLRAHGHARVDV